MPPSPRRAPSERGEQARREAEAKQISNQIDAMLEAERAALARHTSIIRVLLLGQSESGKSTVLKNFQLMYAREAFIRDRQNWKGVILLNVVRCMQRVVASLVQADAAEDDDSADELPHNAPPPISVLLTDTHRRICSRLRASLDLAERGLKSRLSPSTAGVNRPRSRPTTAEQLVDEEAEAELAVQAHSFTFQPPTVPEGPLPKQSSSRRLSLLPQDTPTDFTDPNDPTSLIVLCRQDMIDLWQDPAVKEVLARRKVRWHEWPGLYVIKTLSFNSHTVFSFLNDLERVTAQVIFGICPSNPFLDDVVRARLKTMGVSDYSFVIDQGPRGTVLWRIFDVGGARTQRNQWIPYFEDANAVIFLAPLSAFDQKLAEDRSVNRLEDSLLLWKSVCANKLLANANFILFLNKVDILSAKLRNGVKVQKYVRSFRDRPNTAEAAAKYFKDKFHAIQREYSPRKRPFYCYLTSAIDIKATNAILDHVGESILRSNLQKMGVL
ncbi:G-alpha-domain-containing protein [Serendipita vermifera]|nr:G-alpha-domain-containing protein [Serendipita vermifera]